jgi:hypothetical protein
MPVMGERSRLTSGDTEPPKEKLVSSRRRHFSSLASALHTDRAMIERIGACVFVSLLAVGCTTGDDEKLEPRDPNPQKIVCSDQFKLNGTFTPGTPARPVTDEAGDPFTGCWPVGTWTFTAAIEASDENIPDITDDGVGDRCGRVEGTQVAVADGSYSFTVTRTPDPDLDYKDSYAVVGAVPEGMKLRWNNKYVTRVKVTEGGGLECEGGLELLSMDGKSYWNMKPSQGGTTIIGFGEFRLFQESQDAPAE